MKTKAHRKLTLAVAEKVVGIPNYSRNMQSAMDVLEFLRQHCCCVDLHSDHHYAWKIGLRLGEDSPHGEGEYDVRVNAKSLPVAICKAALKLAEILGLKRFKRSGLL